ncbi:CDC50/LEM3 family [Carpediemonas membranifera]|uniref:CDC50/LEM3 family n=1 Tax=Carpediemonas membranifera TaxID=201153 RepID=A0A8J6B3V6_9EUKA|nr:CDC50/LEM3 family [Carpediemonas membranifera]|eukprot:KAG9393754.1 CDC50/LEM3 family [Carpediemonas membranifera]
MSELVEKTQKLTGWITHKLFKEAQDRYVQPVLTPIIAGTCMCLSFMVLAIITAFLAISQNNRVAISKRYDDLSDTSLTMSLAKDMKNAYLFYELDDFYQNHKRFADSISWEQLSTGSDSQGNLEDACTYTKVVCRTLSDTCDPCGLVYRAHFNDTFTLTKVGGSTVTLNPTVGWKTDRDNKFDDAFEKGDPDRDRLTSWMRVSGLGGKTLKPYAKVGDLDKGDYTLAFNSVFPVNSFSGQKRVILMEVGDVVGAFGWGLPLLSGAAAGLLLVSSLAIYFFIAAKLAVTLSMKVINRNKAGGSKDEEETTYQSPIAGRL